MSNTRFNGRQKVAFSLSLYFDDISMTFQIGLLIRAVLYLPFSCCLFPAAVLAGGEESRGREVLCAAGKLCWCAGMVWREAMWLWKGVE